ncbi:MAG: protease modulator HflC [Alphaproteobacteria bacterium]
MQNPRIILLAIVVGALAILANSAFFTVQQREQALVLQFGNPVRVVTEPGLYIKTPFLQNAEKMEKRVLNFDADTVELVTKDSKRLVVDAFARWRIVDPLKFFQSVRTELTALNRLESLVNATVREMIAKRDKDGLLSGERAELMREIAASVTKKAERLGIEIVDVRLRRVDLPEANSQSVYKRMQAEREREAREARAKGAEDAQRIQADADRQVTVLLAEANKTSQILRGEGEAESNRIFAEAYGRDANFFEFYRSMQAYTRSLQGGNTTMVIDPNSRFFKYFDDPSGN